MPAPRVDDVDAFPNNHLLTLFEALNHGRKELFVGLTALLPGELATKFWKGPPRPLAHWKKAHKVEIRCIVYSIPKKDAPKIAARIGKRTVPEGWTLLR